MWKGDPILLLWVYHEQTYCKCLFLLLYLVLNKLVCETVLGDQKLFCNLRLAEKSLWEGMLLLWSPTVAHLCGVVYHFLAPGIMSC